MSEMGWGITTKGARSRVGGAARLRRRPSLGPLSGELALRFTLQRDRRLTVVFARALFVATTALLALEFMRGRGGRSSKPAAGPSTFGDTAQV